MHAESAIVTSLLIWVKKVVVVTVSDFETKGMECDCVKLHKNSISICQQGHRKNEELRCYSKKVGFKSKNIVVNQWFPTRETDHPRRSNIKFYEKWTATC